MDEMTATVVPLGSLAILFAGVSVLILLNKAFRSRAADEAIKSRMAEKKSQRNRPLSEQKKQLEELFKK